jgi:enterochelin esterase-like enzyme
MHRRPLLVLLHELTGSPGSTLTSAVFAALTRLGPDAPYIVSPYSPADSYWHDRAGQSANYKTKGAWGSYVVSEVIPRAIKLLHADPRRILIAGNSMGGFGALDIARLHLGLFCGVAAHSPSLFRSYSYEPPRSSDESGPDHFDSAADFARHDLFRTAATHRNLYGRAQVWIDAGNGDQHVALDQTLAQLLQEHGSHVQFHVWPGEHDAAYWNLHQDDYFHFYETALAHCVT